MILQRERISVEKEQFLSGTGRIFQAVKENPEYTDEQIAGDVACTVEEVKAVRNMFSI